MSAAVRDARDARAMGALARARVAHRPLVRSALALSETSSRANRSHARVRSSERDERANGGDDERRAGERARARARNAGDAHGAELMSSSGTFAELELQRASAKVKGVRVRQHVNPLSARYRAQARAPKWEEAYDDRGRGLVIDIGCGGGRFDLLFAKRNEHLNVLGVDVRQPLVERGNEWGREAGVTKNAYFAECNATVSIGEWIRSYNAMGLGTVELVCAQFCDPHFKKRHRKRRIVQRTLVEQLARELTPGARVFLQSDVRELAEDMRDKFERFGEAYFGLDETLYGAAAIEATATTASEPASEGEREDGDDGWRSTWAHAGWLDENPLGIPTEREIQTTGEGLPVFRVMLRRNGAPFA